MSILSRGLAQFCASTSASTHGIPALVSKTTALTDWAVYLTASVLGGTFLFYALGYLWLGHWVVTHFDFWRIYDVYLTHGWLQSALLKHNGHSLFFPSFIYLANFHFFHASEEFLFWLGLILLFISVALLLVPIWRDQATPAPAKTLSTLTLVVGTFWMARAPIIDSGQWICNASVFMLGAEIAFLVLPAMGTTSVPNWPATVAVVAGGFVASFSGGLGLAIWPTLLLLCWCLRLPWRCFALLFSAAVLAGLIFVSLPPAGSVPPVLPRGTSLFAYVPSALNALCRIISAPVFYAISAWRTEPFPPHVVQSSLAPLLCGTAALLIATWFILRAVVRRDLLKSDLQLVGIALLLLNLFDLALIVVGRADIAGTVSTEIAAPRYFFSTTLLWVGLILLLIRQTTSLALMRWPVYIAVLGLPIFLFPAHRRDGMSCRWARHLSNFAATALIDGVRDDGRVRFLFPNAEQVYRVARRLRPLRLDMFAPGYQEWIAHPVENVYAGRHRRQRFIGECHVAGLLTCDTGEPAARVVGQLWESRRRVAMTAVIVDPTGMVCGIGRSSHVNPMASSVLYGGKLYRNLGFVGYIRGYNPSLQYVVRSADDGVLSDETVVVQNSLP